MVIVNGFSAPSATDNPSRMSREHKFLIHKDFICYYSPFFSAAFNGSFNEGRTQIMMLEDVDPRAFGILVNWIYTQGVEIDNGTWPNLVTCAKLWILADRFLMRKMQNDVMVKIHFVLTFDIIEDDEFIDFADFARMAGGFKEEDNHSLE
jgi:hypothetical protein